MDDNELLKVNFQKLHTELVGQNLSSVVDRLFAAQIISAEDMEELNLWSGAWSTAKSRQLMTLLHRCGHPRAFTELRLALSELDSMQWIVEKLDQLEVEDKSKYLSDVVQCQCPNCGHPHQPSLTSAVSEYAKNEINFLFLGETGVGKSTLINALAIYLHFSTLSDAEAASGFFPVPISFTVTDPTTYRRRTISTGYDANERNSCEGGSVTLSPTAYVLNFGNIRVNLIDTPGVKSTDGSCRDKSNAHEVLSFVSAYEKIDLICIVVKPIEARLTENFRNCLEEILRNLHDSACNNVVFCVTFSKASNYGPGDTYGVLAKFCSGLPKLCDLELSRQTVFCFENEPVRYLADCPRNDDERLSVDHSWRKSVETAHRLLQLGLDVKPHSVIGTLSLNNARRAIVALLQPLVQTAKCVAVNVHELKRVKQKLAFLPSMHLSDGRVEILVHRFSFVQLPHLATVCTSITCSKVYKGAVYKRVCHEHCRWTPTVRVCRVFNRRGSCAHCGCSYRQHAWSTCVPELVQDKLVLNVHEIKQRKDESIKEVTTLTSTYAKLTTFLRDNSFFETVGDTVADTVQRELDTLSAAIAASEKQTDKDDEEQQNEKDMKIVYKGLDRFLTMYTESLKEVDYKYSPSDVHEMIGELFTLPINGAQLKQGVDIVQMSIDEAVKRRRKVFNIHSWMFN